MITKINKLFLIRKMFAGGLKNFAWLFAGNTGSHLLKAIITIYAAQAWYRRVWYLFLCFGLGWIFVFIKNIGVDSILTREVAKYPEKKHHYFFTSFLMEIVLLIITAFLIIFIAPLFSNMANAIILLPFVAFMLIFDDLRGLFAAFFRGLEKMELEAIVNVITSIAIAILGFSALYFFHTPKAFIVAYMLASLIGTFAAIILLRRYTKFSFDNFNRNLIFPILKSAWPFAAGALAGMFLFNIDVIMMGWWRTTSEIGLYSAAQKLSGIMNVGITLIGISIFPIFSRFANKENKEKMKTLMESVMRLVFFIIVPLIIGGVVLRNPLMIFVFGSQYASAANAFAILLFSIVAIYPFTIFNNFVFAYNKHSCMVRYGLASSICNLALGFLLIPKYGMIGASLAMVSSNFIYCGLLWRYAKKINNFNTLSGILKIIIAALIMGIITFILERTSFHIIINIAISGLLYVLFLYLLKEKILGELWSLVKLR